jgi:para-aminobenzoate synthetase/4-amino-4-deoxychorismate lyase
MIEHALIRDDEHWLRFRDPVEVVEVRALSDVAPGLATVEEAVNTRGLWAAGYLAYDASPAFDSALCARAPRGTLPLMLFGLFRQPERLERLPLDGCDGYSLDEWQPSLGSEAHRRAVARIMTHIARGDSYQVNYTFSLRAAFEGDPRSLFYDLQRAQQAAYAAYLSLDGHAICSASPELFLRLDHDRAVCRPMKGTAARGHYLVADADQMEWLVSSEKNRAEHVMIVDMVRNDLGRVAEVGSVEVASLFDVERYPTLLQMTSTVGARSAAPLTEIMRALFPSASITGAPKVRTMELIAELEDAPRGVYTGAIGFISPNRLAQFNVAIRTVVVDRSAGRATYGVGGGIVWDSDAADEYAECGIKARILTRPPPDFDLLETMLWQPESGYFLLDRHLERLREAAAYFVRPCDTRQIGNELQALAERLPSIDHRLRVLVAADGEVSIQATPLGADSPRSRFRIGLAAAAVDSADRYLYFKTTHRQFYEQALAQRPDCDDVLLYNERGELTESCHANLVIRRNGRLVTPPVASGLLAGTFRAELLASGEIQEDVFRVDELAEADEILLINSVRRWMTTEWVEDDASESRRATASSAS